MGENIELSIFDVAADATRSQGLRQWFHAGAQSSPDTSAQQFQAWHPTDQGKYKVIVGQVAFTLMKVGVAKVESLQIDQWSVQDGGLLQSPDIVTFKLHVGQVRKTG